VKTNHFAKAALLMLLLTLTFVFVWELFWRSKGFNISYNDDEALWADRRAQVYQPADKATVFIGASRIKFDLDIPTWEKLTGEKAVQLSIVGSNLRPLLTDLADDPNFNGKLVVDITEPLFFSVRGRDAIPKKAIKFYKNYSPSQKFSSYSSYILESNLVFLDYDRFSLDALLKDFDFENRNKVRAKPVFPKDFGLTLPTRQSYMSGRFLSDTALQNLQIEAWKKGGAMDRTPGVKGDTLLKIFTEVKTAIDKIESRGGKVIFVRTPSSGGYLEKENAVYPRNEYWDKLLEFTKKDGIHFQDYPETATLICPEWSHLSTKDAIHYTKAFVNQLKEKNFFNYTKPSLALSKNY
jgi:hypothetical protein